MTNPIFGGSPEKKRLLYAKSNPEDACDDEKSDDGAAVPAVDGAAEVDRHDRCDEPADGQDRTDRIEACCSLAEWYILTRVRRRQ